MSLLDSSGHTAIGPHPQGHKLDKAALFLSQNLIWFWKGDSKIGFEGFALRLWAPRVSESGVGGSYQAPLLWKQASIWIQETDALSSLGLGFELSFLIRLILRAGCCNHGSSLSVSQEVLQESEPLAVKLSVFAFLSPRIHKQAQEKHFL